MNKWYELQQHEKGCFRDDGSGSTILIEAVLDRWLTLLNASQNSREDKSEFREEAGSSPLQLVMCNSPASFPQLLIISVHKTKYSFCFLCCFFPGYVYSEEICN